MTTKELRTVHAEHGVQRDYAEAGRYLLQALISQQQRQQEQQTADGEEVQFILGVE